MAKYLKQQIRREVKALQPKGREPSAAYLLWFLQNVYRIEPEEAVDIVCDSINDKGIDGILVDESAAEIVVFSSKYYISRKQKTQGDNDIRNLVGAAKWFETPEAISKLKSSTASDELKALLHRMELERVREEGFPLRLVFITSIPFDENAKEFLGANMGSQPRLSAYDSISVNERFDKFATQDRVRNQLNLTIVPGGLFQQSVSRSLKVVILPLKASELVSLEGIEDRSLFARNVRLPIGSTRVNRDITAAVKEPADHSKFLLFHNGITILCSSFDLGDSDISISNYSVVNGCQSVISFYENRDHLTNQLLVLSKVVEVGTTEQMIADEITYRSNNQNPTNMRDQRSNDRIQIELQRDFNKKYGDRVFYIRKRGEKPPTGVEKLENDLAAQLLLSFYAKRPENAHQKWRLFDEYYSLVYSRHTTAPRIYLAFRLFQVLDASFEDVDDELIKNYRLAKFFMLYALRRVLERDDLAARIIEDPEIPIRNHETRVVESVSQLSRLLIKQFNFIVSQRQEKGYFDYKSDLKRRDEVETMAAEIIKGYETGIILYPESSAKSLLTDKGNFSPDEYFD